MKKYLIIFIMAVVVAGLSSCNNYGTKKVFNDIELYYTDKVTVSEADALGNYMKDEDGKEGKDTKTIQLNKEGDVFQVRMVIKENYLKDKEYFETMKILANALSEEVFKGEKVEIHMCNDKLETQKVIKMGKTESTEYKMLKFNGTEIQYDQSVKKSEVNALGNFLIESEFADGTTKSLILYKESDVFVVQIVSTPTYWEDEDFILILKDFAGMISTGAFNGELVEIQLCDENFIPKSSVSMD